MGLHAIIPPTGKQSVPHKRQDVLGKCQLNRWRGGPQDPYQQESQPLLCHIPGHPQAPRRGLGSWPPNPLSRGSASYSPAPDLSSCQLLATSPLTLALFQSASFSLPGSIIFQQTSNEGICFGHMLKLKHIPACKGSLLLCRVQCMEKQRRRKGRWKMGR